jgi:hypothetical protein
VFSLAIAILCKAVYKKAFKTGAVKRSG